MEFFWGGFPLRIAVSFNFDVRYIGFCRKAFLRTPRAS